MKKLIFLAVLGFFLIHLAFALNVKITPNPAGLNSTTQYQLINFTLNNTGNTSIVYVKIAIPNSFELYSGGSTAGQVTFQGLNSGTIEWDELNITNGTCEYFWVNCSVPSIIGEVNFTFFLKDNETNKTVDVSLNVTDVTPPVIEETSIVPENNTKYVQNGNYTFSVDANDNVDLDKVILVFNGTYLPSCYTGKNYSVTITDLPVGCYEYFWFVNDTSNNTLVTQTQIYCVKKSDNPIHIFFNGVEDSNYTLEVNSSLNITVVAKGNINVTQNSSLLGPINPIDKYSYTTNLTKLGLYIYKTYASGNSNYTSNETINYYVKVIYHRLRYKDLEVPLKEEYEPNKIYTFKITWSSPDFPENNITNVSFVWQGEVNYLEVSNFSESSFSFKEKDLKPGIYSWKWCAVDTQGETVCKEGNLEVTKGIPELKLWGIKDYLVGDNITIVGLGCPEQLTCKLYRNNTVLSKNFDDFTPSNPGIIVYIFNTSGNENYTKAEVKGIVNIFQKESPTTENENETTLQENISVINISSSTLNNQTGGSETQIQLTVTKTLKNLKSGKTFSVAITSPFLSRIEKIEVTPKSNISELNITLQPVSLPKKISPPKGFVYTYLKIDSNVPDSFIESVKINFKVSKSWLLREKLDKNSIKLYRFTSSWTELPTKFVKEDSSYEYYQAVSPGFSYYAIVGKKSESHGFPWLWIGIIAAVVVLIYLFWPTEETGYNKLKKKWSFPTQI